MSDIEEWILIDIEEISDEEWADIYGMARQLQNQNKHEGHQGKCWVEAFLLWFSKEDSEAPEPMIH